MKYTKPLVAVCMAAHTVTSAAPIPLDGRRIQAPTSEQHESTPDGELFVRTLLRRRSVDHEEHAVLGRRQFLSKIFSIFSKEKPPVTQIPHNPTGVPPGGPPMQPVPPHGPVTPPVTKELTEEEKKKMPLWKKVIWGGTAGVVGVGLLSYMNGQRLAQQQPVSRGPGPSYGPVTIGPSVDQSVGVMYPGVGPGGGGVMPPPYSIMYPPQYYNTAGVPYPTGGGGSGSSNSRSGGGSNAGGSGGFDTTGGSGGKSVSTGVSRRSPDDDLLHREILVDTDGKGKRDLA